MFEELLVVVPHSGIVIPAEIDPESLAEDFSILMRNVDWHTDWLYDFRDFLRNDQIVFPFCSIVLEANRHPADINESVPLKDALSRPVYKKGAEPDETVRVALSRKYLVPFHNEISRIIAHKKRLLLDAHSTVTARGVADNQIELMNYQITGSNSKPQYFCPDIVIETYADELKKRLPGINITVNESKYDSVYGHVCGAHSVCGFNQKGMKVPAILQETNQRLYMNSDRTVNQQALEKLRRAFGESLEVLNERVFSYR